MTISALPCRMSCTAATMCFGSNGSPSYLRMWPLAGDAGFGSQMPSELAALVILDDDDAPAAAEQFLHLADLERK